MGSFKKWLLLVGVVVLAAGCAPYGPWPFSTEAQRRELLIYPGMTVKEVQDWKGHSLKESHLNPASGASFQAQLPDDYTGVGYWGIHLSHCLEIVRFEKGVAVEIRYGRNEWADLEWNDHIAEFNAKH